MIDLQTVLILNYVGLALAGFCMLSLILRSSATGRLRPYIGAGITALVYLLASVLTVVQSDFSYEIGTYFCTAIATPMLWFNVFDNIWAASSGKEGKKLISYNFLGVQLGYLWTFIMVLCAVGVCATLGTAINNGTPFSVAATQGTIHFVAYGLWAYVLFALLQVLSDRSDIQHFSYSLYAYILLLIIVNIGVTINYAAPTGFDGPSTGLVIAIYVLNRYFALFAVFILLLTGHNWGCNQDLGKKISESSVLEEDREKQAIN